jgi:hypothetical protein
MDAALFHKTEAILSFIRQLEPLMKTALIPPGLTSLVQPLDTAVNGPFQNLLKDEAEALLEELEESGNLSNPWTFKDRREVTTVIVGRAWARLKLETAMISQSFRDCGIFIHPDGREDHLINIKGIDNNLLDSNGWRGWFDYRSHEIVSADCDYITALISASEKLEYSFNAVTLKQLQEQCIRRGVSKSGTKPELLAKLQAHEVQQTGGQKANVDDEEFACVVMLGTPIIEPVSPGSFKAFEFPEYGLLDLE